MSRSVSVMRRISPGGPSGVVPRSSARPQKRSMLTETSMVTTKQKRIAHSARMLTRY
jgi:hypothetical protein